nr:FtsX-like permease family protein [Tissierella sp.]
MKSYKSMTWRYIKGQKNRTLLTIFGIILSISLITAIGTMVVSARGALIKDAIRENGSFHARFRYIDEDQIKKLENHLGVETLAKTKLVGSLALRETTEEERDNGGMEISYRLIDLKEYDENAKEMLPIKLIEGKLPKNSSEIVIEKWTREFFKEDLKVGDTIILPIGNRIKEGNNEQGDKPKESFEETGEKEFKVVGFTVPRYVWRGNLVTDGIIGQDQASSDGGEYYGFITLPDIKDAKEKIIKIGKDIGVTEDDILYNNDLLRLSAESVNDTFNGSIIGILAFVVALIMISTIAVIYNAFNISVIERISQFGLLRSVGATPKQIRSLVYREAAIFTAIAIPIGLVSGVFAMKVVLYVISLIESDLDLFSDMEAKMSPVVFLISSLLGIVTVFLSARGPARRAGSVSPLEAIRNTEDTKKENFKRVKHTGFIGKIFGIEGEIAYKNLRRNKKRFLITVFSMVLSIVLFITFSSFSDFIFKAGIIDSVDMADFELSGNFAKDEDKVYERLEASEDINRIYTLKSENGSIKIEKDKIKQKIIDMSPLNFEEKKGKIRIENSELMSIGDKNLDTLKGLLKEGKIDLETMNIKNGIWVINSTYPYDDNKDSRVLMEAYNLKVGDIVHFSSYSSSSSKEDEELVYRDLKVVGVLEKGILGREYNTNGGLNIITTEGLMDELTKENDNDYITMYVEAKTDGDRENIAQILGELEDETAGLRVVDYAEVAQEMRNMTIIMSIFLYGFVTIISIISAINIINTISTNIILRTREIAMIKAIGMTNSGIKKMVAFESIFYGLYASIFGSLIGVGLSYVLFRLVGEISEFQYIFPLKNVILATVGALVIAILSGVYPLKRINDKIIVESMKETN